MTKDEHRETYSSVCAAVRVMNRQEVVDPFNLQNAVRDLGMALILILENMPKDYDQ